MSLPRWALSPSVIAFINTLRVAGLQIGTGETTDALAALSSIVAARRENFRLALRQTLAKSREDQAIFDRVFDNFWDFKIPENVVVADDEHDGGANEAESKILQGGGAAADLPVAAVPEEQTDAGHTSGASGQPRLMQRDFALVSDDEVDALRDLVALIGKRLASRAGRRWRSAATGPADIRRSMRSALSRGGELWEIKQRRRRPQRLSLVVLADVSYSMDAYSRFFLQFVFEFQNLFRRMETFVFSTRLSRVTSALRRGRLAQALDALPETVEDWAGGTRISESIDYFMHQYGDALLSRHTVVIIVSDGWDTGSVAALDQSLRELRRRCRQILWLDPLKGHPGYFSSGAGAHTDSRWVDHCLAARDLQSLQTVADALGK